MTGFLFCMRIQIVSKTTFWRHYKSAEKSNVEQTALKIGQSRLSMQAAQN